MAKRTQAAVSGETLASLHMRSRSGDLTIERSASPRRTSHVFSLRFGFTFASLVASNPDARGPNFGRL